MEGRYVWVQGGEQRILELPIPVDGGSARDLGVVQSHTERRAFRWAFTKLIEQFFRRSHVVLLVIPDGLVVTLREVLLYDAALSLYRIQVTFQV